jgi:flagellar protein FlaJ
MALNAYQKFCYKSFRNYSSEAAKKNPELDLQLEKAQINVRAEVFIAVNIMNSIVAAIVGVIVAFVLTMIVFPILATLEPSPIEIPFVINIIVWLMPVFFPVGAYFIGMSSPGTKMKARAKNIDKNLPYAVNYMAAMASAEVSPTLIFRGLSRQEIYGEIQAEAKMVARDIDMFGKDIIKVLHRAMNRSPSLKFQDFLQGIITTSTSGGSLKSYFMAKGDQFMRENRVEQMGTLETLGVMAESFVTVVVAAPLFLLIMMSVMAMLGGAGGTSFLYLIVFIMIPVCQFAFIVILSGIETE